MKRGYPLALLALLGYAALAPTTIVDGDNAEFAAIAALGGRAHPSGYPLYTLWLRAWSWLPAASPAHAAALATVILAALVVLVLHAACRAWGARPGPAALAVALVAASPIALRLHTIAEVFALNDLVAAAILLVAAPDGPLRGGRRTIALAAIAGLGLSNHMTCALLAPIGLYGAWRGVREATRAAPVIAGAVGAFVLGLAPNLYLAFAPDTPASWGAGHGLGDMIDHVLRKDYGTSDLVPGAGDPAPGANLVALAATLGRAWLYLPLVAGLAALAVKCARGPSRGAWIALAGSWLLVGPVFVARFNLVPSGADRFIVERFHLLPALVLAVPIAAAFDQIPSTAFAERWAMIAAGVAFVVLVAVGRGPLARQHSAVVEANLADTLRALPDGAVLVASSDEAVFGAPYVQDVLGVRPDVTVIVWSMSGRPWYAARLRARGIVADPLRETVSLTRVLADGRAVFVDALQGSTLARLPSFPFVGVFRVLPPGASPPTVGEVAALNRDAFSHFDLSYPTPGRDDGYPTVLHLRYAETWASIAQAYEAAHDPESAASARAIAGELVPQ